MCYIIEYSYSYHFFSMPSNEWISWGVVFRTSNWQTQVDSLWFPLWILYWGLHTRVPYLCHLHTAPPPMPPMSPNSSLTIVTNIYSHLCIYESSFLRLFSAACVHISLGMTAWDWITWGLAQGEARFFSRQPLIARIVFREIAILLILIFLQSPLSLWWSCPDNHIFEISWVQRLCNI